MGDLKARPWKFEEFEDLWIVGILLMKE